MATKGYDFLLALAEEIRHHYMDVRESVTRYDTQIHALRTDKTRKPDYINSEVGRLVNEQQRLVNDASFIIKSKCKAIMDLEKQSIKGIIKRTPPTDAQERAIRMTQSASKLTQLELDGLAEICDGSYLAQKLLSEAAQKHHLQHGWFQPIEDRLLTVDRVAKDLESCYQYKGERFADGDLYEQRDRGASVVARTYFLDDEGLEQYRSLYNRGSVVENPVPPTPMERLRMLKDKYPERQFELAEFAHKHESQLGEELFATQLDELEQSIAKRT